MKFGFCSYHLPISYIYWKIDIFYCSPNECILSRNDSKSFIVPKIGSIALKSEISYPISAIGDWNMGDSHIVFTPRSLRYSAFSWIPVLKLLLHFKKMKVFDLPIEILYRYFDYTYLSNHQHRRNYYLWMIVDKSDKLPMSATNPMCSQMYH